MDSSLSFLMPFVRDPAVSNAGHPFIASMRRQMQGQPGQMPQGGVQHLPGNESRVPAPPAMGGGGGGMPAFGGGGGQGGQLEAIAQALQMQAAPQKPSFGPRRF